MKFKYYSGIIIFSAIVGLFSACREFIEPNLKNSQINPQAPGNNYQTTGYTLNFWWDTLDGATTYRLQVVTPKFDSIGGLIIDTLIKKNTFALTLSPGNYQWHVRAENGASQTAYSTARSFTVLYSSIKQQSAQLISPANNAITNQSSVTFQWNSIYGATKYRLEIDTNNFINESAVIYNQVFPGQQYTYTFPKDQIYQWRVRAENDTAQAKWSNINTITYNHTPPGVVTLVSPLKGQTVSLPVSLQWSNVSKAIKYKVYVLKSDSTTLYNQSFPATVSTTNYSFNLGAPGDRIYWKVTAVDAAGNESQPSVMRNFILH